MAAIWGALEGLGSGLQEYGTTMYKSQLADKLEKQREARAEERQIAKERRDAEKIVGQKTFRDAEGVPWTVGVDAAGFERGERTLASKQEILEFNRAEAAKERKDALDALTLLKSEREAADYGIDKELDRRYKQSQIDQMGDASARGWAAINLNRDEHNARLNSLGAYGRGSSGGLEGDLTDEAPGKAAADWIKENNHIIGDYLKPNPSTGKAVIDPNELMRVVSTAIQTATERGKDINQTVVGALVNFPAIRDERKQQGTK